MLVKLKVKIRPQARILNLSRDFSENGIYDVVDMQPIDRDVLWCIINDKGVPNYISSSQLIVEDIIYAYDNNQINNSVDNTEDRKISPAIKTELSKLRSEIKALKNE